jgi:hypothetical protein
MTTPTHTHGPWFIWAERALREQEGCDFEFISDELLDRDSFDIYAGTPVGISLNRLVGCERVCEVDAFDFEYDRSKALSAARLIAAAPELLKMVIDLLDAMGDCDSDIENDARALVSKATGGAA